MSKLEHLQLIFKEGGPRRKVRLPISPPERVEENKRNRDRHSQHLTQRANSEIVLWDVIERERMEKHLPDLPKDKPLLINVPPETVDLDFLRTTLGFEVVCEYDDGFVIVATDPDEFKESVLQKIEGFSSNVWGTGNISSLYDIITEETKDQRLKRILSEEIYDNWNRLKTNPDQTIIVEIAIECMGKIVVRKKPIRENYQTDERYQSALTRWEQEKNRAYEEFDELAYNRQQEIGNFIREYNGHIEAVYDCFDDDAKLDSFDMKIKVPARCLLDLAENYPYVFEVKLPDEFDIDTFNEYFVGEDNLQIDIKEPNDGSPTVCVIDSGIQENHLYLSKAVRGEISKSYLTTSQTVVDQVSPDGHGTRVTGAILYPSGVSNISSEYILPCHIANARVLDESNCMPNDLLPSKLIYSITKDFKDNHGIRIFNHSIASRGPCKTKYMSSWATSIDNVAFEKDILFVQSTGNIEKENNSHYRLGIKNHLDAGREYPTYILEDSSRIANPAQSTQALTVGSIAHNRYESEDLFSFGEEGSISSFSRSGFGLWKSIKPEVVEYGGDWVRSKRNNNTFIIKSDVSPELIRRSPEGPPYGKDGVGTSFSTPKVTHIAAELEKLFPNNSTLLYRALIVQSARWSNWAYSLPESDYINVLRYMGYGLPNIERATSNDEYRVTFITTEEKDIYGGDVHIYRVIVPEEIKALNAEIRIDITLTFAAKPRRTRKDFKGYFSTRVDWECSKSSETVDAFINRMIESPDDGVDNDAVTGDAYTWTIGKRDSWGKIKGVNRDRSATQKDWIVIPAYDLQDDFCIAVHGRNGWSKTGEHEARYSLVVGFEAVNRDIEIYTPFKVQIETETTVNTEIETEIQID